MERKNIVSGFFIGFFVFFVVGCINGKNEVKDPLSVGERILQKTTIMKINDQIYLCYKEKDAATVMFSVDSEKLTKLDKEWLLKGDLRKITDRNLLDYLNNTVAASLGTGFVGFTFKEILTVKSVNIKEIGTQKGAKVIMTIIGSIIGYNLGYWIAKKVFTPDENSEEYATVLVSNDHWKWAKKEIIRRMIFQIVTTVTNTKNTKLKLELLSDFQKFKEYLQQNAASTSFMSNDYLLLINSLNKIATYSEGKVGT